MSAAIQAQPTTEPDKNQNKTEYGLFDIRSRVVQQYTHQIGKTKIENVPTLVAWLACKNMEFLWWIKTDLAKCVALLEMIAEKHGISVNANGQTASGPAALPDFMLANGIAVTEAGTQNEKSNKGKNKK